MFNSAIRNSHMYTYIYSGFPLVQESNLNKDDISTLLMSRSHQPAMQDILLDTIDIVCVRGERLETIETGRLPTKISLQNLLKVRAVVQQIIQNYRNKIPIRDIEQNKQNDINRSLLL